MPESTPTSLVRHVLRYSQVYLCTTSAGPIYISSVCVVFHTTIETNEEIRKAPFTIHFRIISQHGRRHTFLIASTIFRHVSDVIRILFVSTKIRHKHPPYRPPPPQSTRARRTHITWKHINKDPIRPNGRNTVISLFRFCLYKRNVTQIVFKRLFTEGPDGCIYLVNYHLT